MRNFLGLSLLSIILVSCGFAPHAANAPFEIKASDYLSDRYHASSCYLPSTITILIHEGLQWPLFLYHLQGVNYDKG